MKVGLETKNALADGIIFDGMCRAYFQVLLEGSAMNVRHLRLRLS